MAVAGLREPAKLRSVLGVVAARSAQEHQPESMYAEAAVAKTTLFTHLDLLENLQVLVRLPAVSREDPGNVPARPNLP